MSDNHPKLQRNRCIPSTTVIPVLAYHDVRNAVDWLNRVFGFVERLRIGEHRAQMIVPGGGAVIIGEYILADKRPEDNPGDPACQYHSVMVRIPDVNSHFERVKSLGAEIIEEPVDHMYGERQYAVHDLGGHRWIFSETLRDVHPSEWGGELKAE